MVHNSYSLSPLQQGMLFHSLYAPGSGTNILQVVGSLHEDIDAAALEAAWQRVIDRHPVLRTSFRWEGVDQPIQEVHHRAPCRLERQDWRGLAAPEQSARFESYLQADQRHEFELDRAPLMRLALFQCGRADYRFAWSVHHIVLDGRSLRLVLKEVFAFYEAFCQGVDLGLKPARPYWDYIEWLQKQDVTRNETFWRQLLAGFSGPTLLRVGRGAPDGGREYGMLQCQLPDALSSVLQSAAEHHQLTLNTLLQGAWALLLGRYSGEGDVIFGATRSCRRSALAGVGTEAMVGLFINTLPIRAQIVPDMPVLTWLRDLRHQSLALRDDLRDHTPLIQVQEWSEVPRGLPLFDNILVFERDQLGAALQAEGGNWFKRELELRPSEHPNYPITLMAYGGAQISFVLRYERSRLEDGAAGRLLGHMQTVLQGLTAIEQTPGLRLFDVPLLTETERHQLVDEWNKPSPGTGRSAVPPVQCIHQLFQAQAERVPAAVAAVFEDRSLTYEELNRRANQLAHHLKGLGVGPELLVGICLDRSLEMVVALLGVLKAGGAYVPLDPSLPLPRLAGMIESSQMLVLLTHSALRAQLKAPSVVCLDTDWDVIAQEKSHGDPPCEAMAENLAYVIFTSGSTGEPKGVAVEHRQLVNYLIGVLERLDLPAGSSFAMVSTFAADLGNTALFPALCTGGCLHIVSQERSTHPDMMADYFQRHAIDCLKIVPSHMAALLAASHPERLLPRKCLVLGGEAVSWELIDKLQALAPSCVILNHYGPTETTVGVITCRLDQASHRSETVPLGRPLPNTQIYLLGADLQPVPLGVPGELYIGGEGLARGYLGRPELTADSFIPHPFSPQAGARLYRSGDLARYLPESQIEFLGRTDDQVKLRGFRIELEEIRAALLQHPAVQESTVILRQDQSGHEQLVAYIVCQPSTLGDQLLGPKLREYLKQQLPLYMIPAAFVFLDALPLTPNGKVDRRALLALDVSRIEKVHAEPRSSTEKTLAMLWANVLGLSQVGIYDDFFELGGHSLLAMQMLARLRNTFQLNIPLRYLFEAPTIAGLAELIETVKWASQSPSVSDAVRGEWEVGEL